MLLPLLSAASAAPPPADLLAGEGGPSPRGVRPTPPHELGTARSARRFLDPADVFVPFVEQGRSHPIPDRRAGSGARFLDVYRAGDLAVLHDPDGEWLTEAMSQGGNISWILNSVQDAFYGSFGDDYQYLTILMVHDFGFFGAFYSPLANDVTGIGYENSASQEVFDNSANGLDGFIFMNYAGYWEQYPALGRYVFGQEFMHRWGAFVHVDKEGLEPDALLGRDSAHWSYFLDTPNSPMEGNRWVDNGDGTYTTDSGALSTYSDLDLYLMGLVGPEEVGPQTFLQVSDEAASAAGVEPATTPAYLNEQTGGGADLTLPATPIAFSLGDIISAEGPRVPSVDDSPKSFRMAFLVVVLSDDTFGDTEVAALDQVRQSFEADWEEDVGYRADLDTTLGDNTAPVWGAPADTGGADTGPTDTADTIDCCKEDADPAACGCDSVSGTGGLALGALALALVTARRRGGVR